MEVTRNIKETVISQDAFLGAKVRSELTIVVPKSEENFGKYTCNASNLVGYKALEFTVTDTCPEELNILLNVVAPIVGTFAVFGLCVLFFKCTRVGDADGGAGADGGDGNRTPLLENNPGRGASNDGGYGNQTPLPGSGPGSGASSDSSGVGLLTVGGPFAT
ncbi:uncharacterized protein [Amphiura filiformis]|uniref:uncharacterized protein n=1 Tax=Amphiura filiformis TaxID=82378 RepID=UPI003B20D715